MTDAKASSLDQVDMMHEAREAQWSALSFLGPNYKKGISPAKVNLFFDVLDKKENGYHDVVNIMHALAVHDTLYMSVEQTDPDDISHIIRDDGRAGIAGPNDNLAVYIDMADKTNLGDPLDIPVSENLVFKAIDLLARRISHDRYEKIEIRIEKQIPHQAGLGGGSSNATTALAMVASFWGLDANDASIRKCAEALGADVAFFLDGGCGQYGGNGATLVRSITPVKFPVVLVKPPCGVPTAEAFRIFDKDPSRASNGQLEEVQRAENAADVPLFNSLYTAAISVAPEIENVRQWLCAQEGVNPETVLLSGSGAAQFAIVDSFATASQIAANAKARGFWAKPTTLSSLRSAVI